ncbi:MAG: DUF47 domain-containing protein [Alphaproteobacteria bacterium]
MDEEQGFVLFKRTREIELKMAEFLTNIIHGGFLFSAGIEKYFSVGIGEELNDIRDQVSLFEAKNDELRRSIEIGLYVQMILPDMRSDILRLLEGCDQIINLYEENLIQISVEKPKVPVVFQEDITQMIKTTLDCVNALIEACRCFFSGKALDEYTKQVSFYEHQVDMQAMELKRKIFADKKLPLARQMQLNEGIYRIERISDKAEDVADRVSVMAVKHSL